MRNTLQVDQQDSNSQTMSQMVMENTQAKTQHAETEPLQSDQMPGRKNLRLFKDHNKLSRQRVALNCRINALKILALALLSSVEALEKASASELPVEASIFDEVRRFESELIKSALAQTGGRQRPAARLLGIKSATFNAKVKRYNIDSSVFAGRAHKLRR
jgi:DNA-binding NtrC family response regulator